MLFEMNEVQILLLSRNPLVKNKAGATREIAQS
jgi:hypothetical protein